MTPAYPPLSPEDEALIDQTYERVAALVAKRRLERAIENYRAVLRAEEVSQAYISFVRRRAKEMSK